MLPTRLSARIQQRLTPTTVGLILSVRHVRPHLFQTGVPLACPFFGQQIRDFPKHLPSHLAGRSAAWWLDGRNKGI